MYAVEAGRKLGTYGTWLGDGSDGRWQIWLKDVNLLSA